jgi:hypothetical protein
LKICCLQAEEYKKKYKIETCNSYKILVGKLQVKRPLGTSRHRWEDNVKLDLKEIRRWLCRLLSTW